MATQRGCHSALHLEIKIQTLVINPCLVQLNNLTFEYWQDGCLMTIASRIGNLLKVDEKAIDLEKSKFVKICKEIHLSMPIKLSIWIGHPHSYIFQPLTFEIFPICHKCGLHSHRGDNYSSVTPLLSL